MRTLCVGGGPAGLYAAIALTRGRPDRPVTVWERNPPGVTHGWGVVFWDDLLDEMHRVDPVSARAVRRDAVVWHGQAVRVGRRAPVFLGGSGYAIGRHRLLELLADRATDLGVDLRRAKSAPADLDLDDPGALLVGADGAGSPLRHAHAAAFGARVEPGTNRYLWLGTPRLFTTFTFGFVDTGCGWAWCHAYRFDATTSTFIVEVPPATWTALGLDRLDAPSCLAVLGELFEPVLHGAPLWLAGGDGRVGTAAPWQRFRQVTTERWHHGHLALVGDAAHTTHFAIGSGTRLAIGDAVALAASVRHVERADQLPVALAAYGERRRREVRPWQEEAVRSSTWFENATAALEQGDDLALGWSLWQRRSDAPAWRWYVHRASQHAPLRGARMSAAAARRQVRAARRAAGRAAR